MNRRNISKTIVAVLAFAFLAGCARNTQAPVPPVSPSVSSSPASVSSEQTGTVTTDIADSEISDQSDTQEADSAGDSASSVQDNPAGFSYADLKKYEFTFSSGAGGWRTIMTINEDGSFQGNYGDSDMGSTGPDHPNGTYYYCDFSGRLSEPEYVDDYTCKAVVESLTYEDEPQTETIVDGVLRVASGAYGIEGADTVYIYLPGKPVSDLSESYRSWWYWGMYDEAPEELPFYGLYNEAEEYGFTSDQIVYDADDLKKEYENALIRDREIDDEFHKGIIDQQTMNRLAFEQFTLWDDLLNHMWAYLAETLPEAEMEALRKQQREWIAEKEAAANEESSNFEGGSMWSMVYYGVCGSMTKDRVAELMQLIGVRL